ncbi:MAG: hypothetical protein F7C35_02945 [Desulfurococcales archaeon]|nr:hypothetical protein [Desulfurococcales archaeon]
MDVLIRGDMLFTGEELVRDAYLYMKNGKIIEMGSGTPPEEYTFASLIIGGPGRFIGPALVAPVDPIGYLVKSRNCTVPPIVSCEVRRRVNEEILSLPALLEAHTRGIGRVFLVVSDISVATSLAEKLGAPMGAVIPGECREVEQHPKLERVVPLSDLPVDPLVCPSRQLARLDDPYTWSMDFAKAVGVNPPVIREGDRASIVVYDMSQPPLMGLQVGSVEDASSVYSMCAKAESLLYGDNVLVEVGSHLLIVEKHLKEARREMARIY